MPDDEIKDTNENLNNNENNINQEDEPTPAQEDIAENLSEFQQDDYPQADDKTVTVQPVQFASFDDMEHVQGPPNQHLNILLDV